MIAAPQLANGFGIDVETSYKRELIRRLSNLVTTHNVEDNGVYVEDPAYSQVFLTTAWSEVDLDRWLSATKNICYVGIWSRGKVEI